MLCSILVKVTLEIQNKPDQSTSADVQDASSLGLVWFGDEEEDYDEEQLSVPSATGAKQRRDQRDQKDPDYQMPSR